MLSASHLAASILQRPLSHLTQLVPKSRQEGAYFCTFQYHHNLHTSKDKSPAQYPARVLEHLHPPPQPRLRACASPFTQMFCLRIWLLPLFFLSSAPPLYLLLFLTATYVLQRPCVYCSLLLLILVLALFDFSGNWFEPPSRSHLASPANSTSSANATTGADSSGLAFGSASLASCAWDARASLSDLLGNGAAFIAAAVNSTASVVVEAAVAKMQGQQPQQSAAAMTTAAAEVKQGWGRSFWTSSSGRRELRIPCVNAVIRL